MYQLYITNHGCLRNLSKAAIKKRQIKWILKVLFFTRKELIIGE